MPRRGRRRLLVLGLAAALTAITTHRVCDLIYACGCTWAFAGGTAHCNIHAPQPPHCPACSHRGTGALLAFGVFSAWAGVLHVVARRRD